MDTIHDAVLRVARGYYGWNIQITLDDAGGSITLISRYGDARHLLSLRGSADGSMHRWSFWNDVQQTWIESGLMDDADVDDVSSFLQESLVKMQEEKQILGWR